jgi:creatinine amidohydrolase
MRFEDLNWMDVDHYLKAEDRLMIPLGACEQHGFLSLMTDAKIPLALADAASQKTGVLVAPAVNFGISPYFLTYPGTISLKTETLLHLVEDIIRSLYHQNFKRFLVINGHGGNRSIRQKLTELMNEISDLRIAWYDWWIAPSVEEVANKHGLKPYHAAWSENFPFVRVCEVPQIEKTAPTPHEIMNAVQTREVYGDGVFGGDYQASQEVMDEVFSVALQDILQLLEF